MRTWAGRFLCLVSCAALLTACGGDEEDPSGSPSSSPPPSATAEPSTPSVEPASGARVELGSFQVRFPQGWEPRELGTLAVTTTGPEAEHLALTAHQAPAARPLDELIDAAVATGMWSKRPERLEDVEVDGVLMYHLAGPGLNGYTDEQLGAEFGGYNVTLTVSTTGSAADRRDLVDSLLASARWR